MFIDVHCHLDAATYGDLGELISACQSVGVGKIITVGFDIDSSLFGRDCAEKFPSVYFTAGFHPTELSKYKQGDLDIIEDLCKHPKCVALGEIGLDYHYPDTQKELQKQVFLQQLDLAQKLALPVQIHSRDCAEDMLAILKDNAKKLNSGALLHCYSHSTEMAQEFEKLGLYFSFGGASTWKSSKKAKRTIAALSINKLLTETDSPYMPPASLYGTFPNSPKSIPEIAANMAEVKGIDLERIERAVWENARKLFKKLG